MPTEQNPVATLCVNRKSGAVTYHSVVAKSIFSKGNKPNNGHYLIVIVTAIVIATVVISLDRQTWKTEESFDRDVFTKLATFVFSWYCLSVIAVVNVIDLSAILTTNVDRTIFHHNL